MIIILSQGQTNGSRAPAICNSHPGTTAVSSGKNEDDKWIQEHTTQRKTLHTSFDCFEVTDCVAAGCNSRTGRENRFQTAI